MDDETKARSSQGNEKNRIRSVEVSSPLNTTQKSQNIRELIHNKDAGTVTEQVGIRSRGVDSPIRDSDNTKDLSRYNSADNIRQALRELKSPTRASNFDEDASTSKQQPKNSKDKGADSKSLRKMRTEDALRLRSNATQRLLQHAHCAPPLCSRDVT
ncbi:hypothetical protein MSG28_004578 [Choristoneura fumiferana]|uniref:Uncharacterized protein n=1 Tax=Choristoneura fumiferana TaxID=7141 RepID=A0ACC0K6R0_CHOFU|nr:hypothetical protein MSG28_004578 [Choristoneura fumiferana]